jgi:ketosteroid isomerase-like protein
MPDSDFATTDAAAFIHAFRHAWANPTPERFTALSHPDATFVQPLTHPAHGRAAREALVRRLLAVIPDLRGEILSWAAQGDTLFVEVRLTGTFGGRPIGWITLDKIVLRDGRALSRTAHFDSLPLLRAIATRPRGWAAWLRSRNHDRGC